MGTCICMCPSRSWLANGHLGALMGSWWKVRAAQPRAAACPGRRTACPAAADHWRSRCPARCWRDRTRPARSRRTDCPDCGPAPCGRSPAAAPAPPESAWSGPGDRTGSCAASSSVNSCTANSHSGKVAAVDGFPQVATVEVVVGRLQLHGLVPHRGLDARAWAASGTSRRWIRPLRFTSRKLWMPKPSIMRSCAGWRGRSWPT